MKTWVDAEPFKIDKNGTKYYLDNKCKKCGGAGIIPHYAYIDGGVCWECGGSGIAPKPAVIKVYTPEYEQKLAERRAKRQAKQDAERKAKAGEHNAELLEKHGFNAEGITYMVLGNTYAMKDELKELGCKFDNYIGWHSATELDGYDTAPIKAEDMFNTNHVGELFGYGWKDGVVEMVDKLRHEYDVQQCTSEYVGEIGTKIECELTLVGAFSYEVKSFSGYGMSTMHAYVFEDANGNNFVWKTSAYLWHDDKPVESGESIKVKATVKDHQEYNDKKQTVLQRVKIVS